MSLLKKEPGSFRDPLGYIICDENEIYRIISDKAKDQFSLVRKTKVFHKLIKEGKLIEEIPEDLESIKQRFSCDYNNIFCVVKHPKIEFISYPYEWPFFLLKKAALFHLDLHLELLEENLTFSDASAYNVQFVGSRPIFIDSLSIIPYEEGSYWVGYHQFCQHFLYPLLIQKFLSVPYQPFLKSNLEGIPLDYMYNLLPLKKKFNWKVFLHIVLPHTLKAYNKFEESLLKGETKKFSKENFKTLLLQLRDWIDNFNLSGSTKTTWEDYETENSYNEEETKAKEFFISEIISTKKPKCVWDIGCNTGKYSLLAHKSGAQNIIGFDFDPKALELACLRAETQNLPFLPLWMDFRNPSPSQGWLHQERKSLQERANADFLIVLALIHHLVISHNVPLESFVKWMLSLAPQGVIEFVEKDDPMIKRMLALREDIFNEYSSENFEKILYSKADIVQKKIIKNTRILYYFEKRNLVL